MNNAIKISLIVFITLLLGLLFASCGYMKIVGESEVGATFESGKLTEVVGPGFYWSLSPFNDIQTFSSAAVPFQVNDPEIITKDKQRIGVVVTGDAFRPEFADAPFIKTGWLRYNTLWLNEQALSQRVASLAQQAMKVCVGDLTFDDATIGEGRDGLTACIDAELSEATALFGVDIDNLAVPEVVLSEAVQAQLDQITQSRFEKERWEANKLEEQARTEAELAKEQGKIRVEQGRAQEEAKQQAALAKLDVEKELQRREVQLTNVETKLQVIKAQQEQAQAELELARVQAETAKVNAEKSNANEIVIARVLKENPQYVDYLLSLQRVQTWGNVEKMIIPGDANLMFFNPNNELKPVIDVK